VLPAVAELMEQEYARMREPNGPTATLQYHHSATFSTARYIFLSVVHNTVLRVFENRVLRRICGPKRDEVTGE
jgi:hypothetical protein